MKDPRPKIGILTFHRCINYGSYWQARCLVDGLKVRGCDAVLLEHVSDKVNLAEWRCAMRPVLPTPVPRSDHSLYAAKIRKFFCACAKLPCSSPFALDDLDHLVNFDTVLVGSDEVWNLRHPWYGGCPLFFGVGVCAERLASYAASFGNYPAAAGIDKWWADHLRSFMQISVRDENSRTLIRTALGREPELVLDPCLQFPPAVTQDPSRDRPPYVAVYGHNFSAHFTCRVRSWAMANRCSLVSLGYRNDWCDEQWLTAGPQEFAACIAQADAVATNFFHGCVFSLVNCKPFVCEPSNYRSIKIRDLMQCVGGERHLVTGDTPSAEYAALLSEPLDPAIFRRIGALRRTSNLFLDKVLG